MPPRKKTDSKKELRVNVQKLYEHLEQMGDFNSINAEYRQSTFTGNFSGSTEFSGKYGDTIRYTFQTISGDIWSLLSNSVILSKVIAEIPIGTNCEVFKNEKGHWRIIPIQED